MHQPTVDIALLQFDGSAGVAQGFARTALLDERRGRLELQAPVNGKASARIAVTCA